MNWSNISGQRRCYYDDEKIIDIFQFRYADSRVTSVSYAGENHPVTDALKQYMESERSQMFEFPARVN